MILEENGKGYYGNLFCLASDKDVQSLTCISILKRDWGNDTEIGKSVIFKIIDLTKGKKYWKKHKNSILWYCVKGKSAQEILEDQLSELKRSNILIITTDRKISISDKERERLDEIIGILSSLGISRVSVLKGGFKNYLTHLP